MHLNHTFLILYKAIRTLALFPASWKADKYVHVTVLSIVKLILSFLATWTTKEVENKVAMSVEKLKIKHVYLFPIKLHINELGIKLHYTIIKNSIKITREMTRFVKKLMI